MLESGLEVNAACRNLGSLNASIAEARLASNSGSMNGLTIPRSSILYDKCSSSNILRTPTAPSLRAKIVASLFKITIDYGYAI